MENRLVKIGHIWCLPLNFGIAVGRITKSQGINLTHRDLGKRGTPMRVPQRSGGFFD